VVGAFISRPAPWSTILSYDFNTYASRFRIQLFENESTVCFVAGDNSDVTVRSPIVLGNNYCFALSHRNGSPISGYLNGKLIGNSNNVTIPALSTDKGLTIGASYEDIRYYSDTLIDNTLIYNRILSPQEIASLSANPWQIYEPEIVWVKQPEQKLLSYTPSVWTEKPPVGTPLRTDGHWSVQELSGCWMLNEGAGTKVINSAVSTQVNGIATNPIRTKKGMFFDSWDYAHDYHINVGRVVNPTGPVTYITKASVNSYGEGPLIGLGDRLCLRVRDGYIDFFTFASYWNPVAAYYSCALDTPYTFVGIHTTTTNEIYVNGHRITSEAVPARTAVDWDLFIGSDQETSRQFGGEIEYAMVYNRALSASEVASLSANPYQIFGGK